MLRTRSSISPEDSGHIAIRCHMATYGQTLSATDFESPVAYSYAHDLHRCPASLRRDTFAAADADSSIAAPPRSYLRELLNWRQLGRLDGAN